MRPVLHLFGRPDVEHDGHVSPLPAERRYQLLAYLALCRGWIARAELAALLWPDRSADLGLTNLRKALHFARALPWASALETKGAIVRFEIDTDVECFGSAAREGRVVDALRLCRGELLDGLEDLSNAAWSEWLANERVRLAGSRHLLTRARIAQLEGAPHERAALARQLLAADPLDEDAMVALLGAQRALGLRDEHREAYRSYTARLAEELGVTPSARVRALAVNAPDIAGIAADDGFVGRAREVEELSALLRRGECRLLTVTGPGGVGKSHLVKHAVRRLAGIFAGGAMWIALDDLTDVGQVVARIAAELGHKPDPQQDPLQGVCAHARMRGLLLVLDNSEHLPALAQLAERLLNDAGELTICVTSRTRLNLHGEWLLPLKGLSTPPVHALAREVLDSDAARLFVSAASALRPDFDAVAQARGIGALVRAVDGLPLAILLAANWVRLLPVSEIASELARSLDVLESADEGEERPEHRSVRATFEQSWRLLTSIEQGALEALSVFVGTFTLAAASEVARVSLPLLAALADKSLLQIIDERRCAVHPLIRQFAVEKLHEPALTEAMRRHGEMFHRRLAQVRRLLDAGDESVLSELDKDLENCRAAWRWAVANRALDSLAASALSLWRFFEVRGRAAEGLALLREAHAVACVEPAQHPVCAANVGVAITNMLYRLYRVDEALASARLALKFARSARNGEAVFRCLNVLGLCHYQRGQNREAKRVMEQTLRVARAANHRLHTVTALGNLSIVEKALGNYDRSRDLNLEVLAQQRELGDWIGVSTRLNNLAALHQARGEWDLARGCLSEGLEVSKTHGIVSIRPHLLVNLALVEFFAGALDASLRLSHETLAEARAAGNLNVETQALQLLVRLATRRGEYPTAVAHLREAITGSTAMASVPMQLDCVFCFAEIVAGRGDARRACELLRFYIAHPDLEPGDRAVAQGFLDRMAADATRDIPADLDLGALLRQIQGEIDAPPVAGASVSR